MTWNPKQCQRPDDQTLRQKLTDRQFKVTRENGTEPPHDNEYADNHRPGLYVDVICGEPLFTSMDKFDSGTGWPSFTKPIDGKHIVTHTDTSHGMQRVEVRSRIADAHLGHVFDDGPMTSDHKRGQRFCMNSAALRFIPVEDLAKEGYEEYLGLFKTEKE